MASYVKYEVSKEIKEKILEILKSARAGGKIKKGVNEATKSIEAGKSQFIVMAEDVSPEELLIHIPMLCEEKDVPYAYVSSKTELGSAIGIKVPTSCISIEDAGPAADSLKDLLKRIPNAKPKKE